MEIGIFVLSIYSSVARKHGAYLIHAFLSPPTLEKWKGHIVWACPRVCPSVCPFKIY